MSATIKPELIERLKKLAERRVWADGLNAGNDTIIDDYAAGNEDDAYYGGENSGETLLARTILNELGVKFTIEEE